MSFAGPEQEYFLVDKHFFYTRPDLVAAGRSVFGAAPPKGQEFDDHYFGVIPERVIGFMMEVERELFKLGVPVKTRHNEVAPGQFEVAPVFETANVASDHQQLIMSTLRRVAANYDLVCLLHEKPFAGVNGSGKHVNFSFGNATQGNLLDPGDTPHENAQFLVFCGAVIRAVHKFAPLLRSAIASAGNDHRLGANEAPPGHHLDLLGRAADRCLCTNQGRRSQAVQDGRDAGNWGRFLPKLPKDAGDRNRTSPFAFTGNRFEFRAVGSNQSISGPLVALQTAITESCDFVAGKLEAAIAGGSSLNAAIQDVLAAIMTEHGSVCFDGDGYSSEWHAEAETRGLPNLRTTVDALQALNLPEVIEAFDKYNILTRASFTAATRFTSSNTPLP